MPGSTHQQGTRANRAEGPTVLSTNKASLNAYWRNVGIVVGRGAPYNVSATEYRELMEYLIAKHPDGVGLLTVIEERSTPDPEARDIMVKMFRDLWRDMRCVAFIVEGRGFGAAAQRGVLSAFLIASGRSAKIKIFSDLGVAVRWMASELGGMHKHLGVEGVEQALLSATHEARSIDFLRPESQSASTR